METQMQQRSNSRSQPTLDVRNVTLRQVAEAYKCSDGNTKHIGRKSMIYYAIWAFFTIVLIVVSSMSYPPSIFLMIVEILIGVLFSGGLFIFKAKKI